VVSTTVTGQLDAKYSAYEHVCSVLEEIEELEIKKLEVVERYEESFPSKITTYEEMELSKKELDM